MALKLKPERFEIRGMTTVNGTRRKSMPIFNVTIESSDDKAKEDIEVTGLEMKDLTTIKRPDLRKLKKRFDQTKDKEFYLMETGNHTIHIILGDNWSTGYWCACLLTGQTCNFLLFKYSIITLVFALVF